MTIARAGDYRDRLDDQLEWLRAVGFDAEPTWTRLDLAVVHAIRRGVMTRTGRISDSSAGSCSRSGGGAL